MGFDTIVFKQSELEEALSGGKTSIALCDNKYLLPNTRNITYTAIGSVEAEIKMSEADFNLSGIRCMGFIPVFTGEIGKAAVYIPQKKSFSSASSFASSYFLSSYFMTSYRYLYEYEYEFGTSSYASSYTTSYTTSYQTSYSYVTSYKTSYQNSFTAEFINNTNENNENNENHEQECIMVNGYGINLI